MKYLLFSLFIISATVVNSGAQSLHIIQSGKLVLLTGSNGHITHLKD
ncbi:MAG: hypothetical protein WC220_09290 [Pedobacter sp.]